MSYIVPNSNKPVRCNRCPFIDGDSLNCTLMEDSYKYIELACQHIHCPLIEIHRPHGRLGDLDELMTEFMDSDLDHLQRDDWREVIQIVADVPTVIEAEGIET